MQISLTIVEDSRDAQPKKRRVMVGEFGSGLAVIVTSEELQREVIDVEPEPQRTGT